MLDAILSQSVADTQLLYHSIQVVIIPLFDCSEVDINREVGALNHLLDIVAKAPDDFLNVFWEDAEDVVLVGVC